MNLEVTKKELEFATLRKTDSCCLLSVVIVISAGHHAFSAPHAPQNGHMVGLYFLALL